VRKADNLNHLDLPTVLKFASLDLLEPSRSVQACIGISLPLVLDLCETCYETRIVRTVRNTTECHVA